ncbi:MAG: SusC/RagA family TonB-linked outer membrane protein [Bacteroidota bacterium]
MKLTTLLLIFSIMQVSATSFAQKVTLNKKKAPLIQVMDEIRAQTGYDFFYDLKLIKSAKPVTINIKDATLSEALEKCFEQQPFVYEVDDKAVVLKEKVPSFLDKVIDRIKAAEAKGKILDENGSPLVGASVIVKGGGGSATTNINGEFSIANVKEDAVLQISFIGYITKEVKANSDLSAIKLEVNMAKLEEVEINAGYYTVKDRERTGSISRVTAEQIEKQPVNNPLAALIGRMPGVNIEQQSGLNGGGFKIEIRGVNSLRPEGREPLFLVDGVPYPASPMTASSLGIGGLSLYASPLNYLSPSDIESIEILKDADATAIYGSRGSNGVVLIKTKGAKIGTTSVDINMSTGISEVGKKLKFLNTEQYLEMRKEAFKNDGVTTYPTSAYDINGTWDQNHYTDWQKVLIGGTAYNTNINTSISGGNDQTQFSFRGSYTKNGTVTPDDFSDQKGAGSLTANHTSKNTKFKVHFSVSYLLDHNRLPLNDLTQYLNLAPNAPNLYDDKGNLNWALTSTGAATWANPLASIKQPYSGKTNSSLSNALFNYEILPNLFIRSSLGYTNLQLKENFKSPISSKPPSNFATGGNGIVFNTIQTWIIEPQINYRKNLGRGIFDVLLGSTFQKNQQATETIFGAGFTSDLLLDNITSAPIKVAEASSSQYKYNSIFARVNYNYESKYIINVTGRRDGSSRFGPGKQFANFGAIGTSWIFTNEKGVARILPFLSFGKIRASYGITGSDLIPNYGYLEAYTASNPYIDGSGLYPIRISNPDYSWETNKKLEVSLDLGFVKDRLLISSSWYRNRSSNQLVGYTLPDITGFPSIQYNLPAKVQNSGWEFEINTTNISNNKFQWKTSLNLTIPKNILLDYPNIQGSSYTNTYTVGESLFTPRRYHYLGVDNETGLYTVEDKDGNGTINTLDRVAANKSLTNHFYGGFQNSFTYKNFSIDSFFQFVSKTAGYPGLGQPGLFSNQLVSVLERWQKSGDETDIQKFSQSSISGGASTRYSQLINSDRFLDASFIRLKNVSLSWNTPGKRIRSSKLNSLRIFLIAQNLFTITKYPGDPEVLSIQSLPTLRSVSLGLQVNL